MNDERHQQMAPPQVGVATGTKKARGGALDRTFPPAWLLGAAVLFVVLLTIVSGWKIVNLERASTPEAGHSGQFGDP